MTLTRHTFGAISKFSGVALNTRAPSVATTAVAEVDGCDVRELLQRFGSPLFIVSESRLREEFSAFLTAFRELYPATQVAYSYKTNYLTGIRAILHDEGAWAEVVSGLEYAMAERLAVPGHQIVFNGPHKPEADLRRAIKDGAWINVDSFDELTTLEEVAIAEGAVPAVGLRLTARVTDTPWEKFGFSLESGLAEEACRRVAASPSLTLAGLHVHIGTDLEDAAAYTELVKMLIPLMRKLERDSGVTWQVLDLGGGVPIRHGYARGRP
jgi:diaminopimelate decarboxylase